MPPKERYQGTVRVEQVLYDGGTVSRRRAVETARLAQSQAGVATALYSLRLEVNQAFFSALLLQEQLAEHDVLIADLDSRLALVRARVQEGTALPGDSAAVLAELLTARQRRSLMEGHHSAALQVLERLTGRVIGPDDQLALPGLGNEVAEARQATNPAAGRPEFTSFARSRALLGEQRSALNAERLPRIIAFGEGGMGRPGLDQFNRSLDDFWMAGLRVRWSPFNWGRTRREQEALDLQQELVATEEAAFADRLDRETRDMLESIDRLEQLIATDDQIVTLREVVEQAALAQLEEGTITATQYLDRRTELERARLDQRQHTVELARARAAYLTTLGAGVQGCGPSS
jgi:outer membrane protein TolC